jgi:hypothetical protein
MRNGTRALLDPTHIWPQIRIAEIKPPINSGTPS